MTASPLPSNPPPTGTDIARALLDLSYTPDEIAKHSRQVYQAVLRDSARIRAGNFTVIAAPDLHLLFDLYDAQFFAGRIHQLLQISRAPLRFDLSARLTRSAGLTKRFTPRGAAVGSGVRYEIVISTTLLFQTFQDVERTVRVSGLVCHDRLEALQRIFEHELLHLVEMLAWGESSCTAERFKGLAWNLFGHTETRHDLVTQHERARAKFAVAVGDQVEFEHQGVRQVGVVNRITRRATVLVEHEQGQPFVNGKRYLKFYVPLSMLKKVEG
jgi:hypothetical protein